MLTRRQFIQLSASPVLALWKSLDLKKLLSWRLDTGYALNAGMLLDQDPPATTYHAYIPELSN